MTRHFDSIVRLLGNAKSRDVRSMIYWDQSAVRSIRHTHDYTQGFQTYAHQVPVIVPQIAQLEAGGAGHNIDAAQMQFGEVRTMTTDKDMLASLDTITQHLTEASQVQVHMNELCNVPTIDGTGTLKCCEDIELSLNKALDEHEKMIQRIAGDKAATADGN